MALISEVTILPDALDINYISSRRMVVEDYHVFNLARFLEYIPFPSGDSSQEKYSKAPFVSPIKRKINASKKKTGDGPSNKPKNSKSSRRSLEDILETTYVGSRSPKVNARIFNNITPLLVLLLPAPEVELPLVVSDQEIQTSEKTLEIGTSSGEMETLASSSKIVPLVI
ncbi:unnamed protein product [Vicia faba]|uniref:Uncharacterized protein n=1 Tax=Vicia faba TaxID=3906 RepID=A0AAV1AWE3_VICFA|nr:unnamed protein product [Vicia faba]